MTLGMTGSSGLAGPCLIAVALALVGCQSTSHVSLSEAKKITVDLPQSAFTPPPRRATDVLAVLREIETENKGTLPRRRAMADAEPAPGLAGAELADFLFERGRKAQGIGRAQQALRDYRAALKLAKEHSPDERKARFLMSYAHAEITSGDYNKGVEALLGSVAALKRHTDGGGRGGPGRILIRTAQLAEGAAEAGDIAGAEAYASDVEAYARSLLARGRNGEFEMFIRAKVNHSQALLAAVKGELTTAEGLMRDALAEMQAYYDTGRDRHLYDAGGTNRDSLTENWALARNLNAQGRYLEAEAIIRTILKAVSTGRLRRTPRAMDATAMLAEAVHGQGRYDDAAKLARYVADYYVAANSSPSSITVARAHARLGDALAEQRKWQDALAAYGRAEPAREANPELFSALVGANAGWATALVRAGRAGNAETMLGPVLEDLEKSFGPGHRRAASVRAMMGAAQMALGKYVQALVAFRASFPILARWSSSLQNNDKLFGGEARRLIIDSYLAALRREKTKSATREAFNVAAFAQEKRVRKALGASLARSAVSDPALADLARREQDAALQLNSLNATLNDLLSRPAASRPPGAVEDLQKRIAQLSAAQRTLAQTVRDNDPAYAQLNAPSTPSVDSAAAALRPNEVLISTYVGETATYVWAVNAKGAVAMAHAPLGGAQLAKRVAGLRAALDPGPLATLGDIPAFDVKSAHGLYAALLEPLADIWKPAKSMLVVANGPLGPLPFSLLPRTSTPKGADSQGLFSGYRAVDWLARSHAVTQLPSVGALEALRAVKRASGPSRPFVGFGDPFFSVVQQAQTRSKTNSVQVASRGVAIRSAPRTRAIDSAEIERLPRLADTRDEIAAIARVMKADMTRDVFLGARASETQAKTMDLSPYRVISFATHGLVPGDLNGLTQPALALSSPKVTRQQGDGLLSMDEILGLKLNADLAVLSACNTAAADGQGAEAISGLGRAFFYAGARSLLVSNWPVHSGATTHLMTLLFKTLAANPGLARAEAMRRTRLSMIDKGTVSQDGKVRFTYAHPIFWAPFALYGDGGGEATAGR